MKALELAAYGGCGQNPGHLNEVIYGIYSPTNYCSIKTV